MSKKMMGDQRSVMAWNLWHDGLALTPFSDAQF